MMAFVGFWLPFLHLIFGGVRMGRYAGCRWLFVILVILFLTGRQVARWINAIRFRAKVGSYLLYLRADAYSFRPSAIYRCSRSPRRVATISQPALPDAPFRRRFL